MINGPGVYSKYNTILDGFTQEQERTPTEIKNFQHMIRNSTKHEFNEWFELYKSVVKPPKTRKKRVT